MGVQNIPDRENCTTKVLSHEEQVMLRELRENQYDDQNCSEGELKYSVSQGHH